MAEIPDNVRILIGAIYFVTCVIFTAVTVAVIAAILSCKKMRSSATYVIILNILVTALLQLIIHGIGGAMAIVNGKVADWFEKLLGATIVNGWCTVHILAFSLALNRLAIFTNLPFVKEFKTMNATIALIIFSWTCGFYFFTVLCLPDAGLRFFLENVEWDYEDLPLHWLLTQSERVIIAPAFAFTLIIYIVICCRIVWMQKQTNREEIRLLIMAIVTFFNEALLFSIYQFGAFVLPDSPYSYVGANYHWIIEGASHATALLCVNSVLRERIVNAVKKKVALYPKFSSISPLTITSIS